MALIGTEIEYGISTPGEAAPLDPGWASERVVAAVSGLFPGRLDRFLGNGARVYVDHGHPEYSGPECPSARDVLIWERAGDRLMGEAAARAGAALGREVVLHRNNTDGKGRSYGYHENHLVDRSVPWESITAVLTGHLVSRVVLAGAGRVGWGQQGGEPKFQLSQRADFMEALVGLETTIRRPLVNTRDEPHADQSRWRRLHLITGDATHAQIGTLVKVGATALVLAAIAAGKGEGVSRLADPLAAMRAFSRDTTLTMAQPCTDGTSRTALDLQRQYWQLASDHADSLADGEQVLQLWDELITDASQDPTLLADRVDWAAKLALIQAMQSRHGWGWDDAQVAALDLQWHELDPQRGLAAKLEAGGRLRTLLDPAEVDDAMTTPPPTRARRRAELLVNHEPQVAAVDWSKVGVSTADGVQWQLLPDPLTSA